MTKEKRKELRALCCTLLVNAGKTLKSREGQSIAYAFWAGALSMESPPDPYVGICLLSGRVDDLMNEKEE